MLGFPQWPLQAPPLYKVAVKDNKNYFREESFNPFLLIGGIILMGICHLPRHTFSMYELYLVMFIIFISEATLNVTLVGLSLYNALGSSNIQNRVSPLTDDSISYF